MSADDCTRRRHDEGRTPTVLGVRRLSDDEFRATMGQAPEPVGRDQRPPFDFWTYFCDIPRKDWLGHDFSAGNVSYSYVMPGGRWQHVLVESQDKNVNMVLVLDLPAGRVYGHHVLDVNRLYGTRTADPDGTERFVGGMNVPSRLGRMNATMPLAEMLVGRDQLVLRPRAFARLVLTDFVVPLGQLASAARLRGQLMTSGVALRLRDGNEAYFWTLSQQDAVLEALRARGVSVEAEKRSATAALRPWRQQRTSSSESWGVQPALVRLMPVSLLLGLFLSVFFLTRPDNGPERWVLGPVWAAALLFTGRQWWRSRR